MTDKRVNETGGTFVIDRDPTRGGQVMVATGSDGENGNQRKLWRTDRTVKKGHMLWCVPPQRRKICNCFCI